MAKKVPKKENTSSQAKPTMSIEQKLARIKVACIVGAGLFASLILWWMSR